MDEAAMIQRLRGNYGRLKNDRSSWDQYWRDVKKYMCPGRGRFLAGENSSEVNNGQKDDPLCRINCEASRALEVLASGIQSGLTSKARQWFLLTCDDVQLAKEHAVREQILSLHPGARVTVASWFMTEPDFMREGDFPIPGEEAFIETVAGGGYDAIVCDERLRTALPRSYRDRIVDFPHFAVSGRLIGED